jgi:hypothetical protein
MYVLGPGLLNQNCGPHVGQISANELICRCEPSVASFAVAGLLCQRVTDARLHTALLTGAAFALGLGLGLRLCFTDGHLP